MTNGGKILFFDTANANPPTQAAETPAAAENGPCACCEESLSELIDIIRECGQDPVTQLSGYLITEDPTYLPDGTDAQGTSARAIARRVGRDKLLTTLIELYIRYCPAAGGRD
jgi:uncharacterized protein (UPF0297 family)